MPTDKPRVTFTISKEKLEELESYRYKNRIKNQTQAILSLIDKGLSAFEPKGDLGDSTKSAKNAPLYSSEAAELAQDYDNLDGFGKKAVRAVVDVEKARCAEQAQATPKTKLYIAARDGSRIETEIEGDLILPEESSEIP